MDRPLREAALKAIQKFEINHRLPGLNLEKLAGRDDSWTIRINAGHRILLSRGQDEQGEVWFLEDVGPHDSYRGW